MKELRIMKTRWPSAYWAIDQLESAGFEAVVVGGAVRDFLLQKEVKDLDIATNAFPHEVKEIFAKTFDTGIQHGTVTVLVKGEPIEVTTYRTEAEYLDHRRPKEVQFVRHLKDDLARRDFTINALALTKEDELIDYYGGISDLENKWIRCVGNPLERFNEDALRILRAIRFTGQLSFHIESQTEHAMYQSGRLLPHIAKERIKQELDRVWLHQDLSKSLHYLQHPDISIFLPGEWEQLPGRGQGFSKSMYGWAWFDLQQSTDYTFPYSNAEKKHLAGVSQLITRVRENGWNYTDLLNVSDDVIFAVKEILDERPSSMESVFINWLSDAPIRTIQDLNITGKDLMSWVNIKGGPWIQRLQWHIAHAVVEGELLNTHSAIEEWVKRYDNKELTD